MNKEELAIEIAKDRAKREKISKQYRDLTKLIEENVIELVQLMESQDLRRFDNTQIGAVLITTNTIPKVEDWETFWKYIKRKNYSHMVEKRPSVSGCSEFFERGQKVPGINKFEKKNIRITKPTKR